MASEYFSAARTLQKDLKCNTLLKCTTILDSNQTSSSENVNPLGKQPRIWQNILLQTLSPSAASLSEEQTGLLTLNVQEERNITKKDASVTGEERMKGWQGQSKAELDSKKKKPFLLGWRVEKMNV